MDHALMGRQTLRFSVLSVVILILVDCGGSVQSKGMVAPSRPGKKEAVSLTFSTVAQGALPGGKNGRPSLHVVRTEPQRRALASRISVLDRPALEAVDLSTGLVIAAFQGLKPTSGYRIDILAVEASGKVLDVMVKRSSPGPEEAVRQGFECPYHLVQVAHKVFDAHSFVRYRLRDAAGDLLEEGPINKIGKR